jgi:hypothetical protein
MRYECTVLSLLAHPFVSLFAGGGMYHTIPIIILISTALICAEAGGFLAAGEPRRFQEAVFFFLLSDSDLKLHLLVHVSLRLGAVGERSYTGAVLHWMS